MAFCLNNTFNTFKDFESLKNQYQQEKFVQLSIVQSEKYPPEHKYCNTLVYKKIYFGCKFGSKKHTSQATKRNSFSYKQNCPFKLILKAVKGKLVIKQLSEVHNGHPISEKDFKHLPEQRRLTPEETEEAVKFLRSKGSNKKELQKFLIQKTNKVVLLTDIHRIASKMKSTTANLVENKTDIRALIDELCSIPSSVVEVTINNNNDLLGIYFQEKWMIDALREYPEVVLMNATYKLPEYGMPVVLLLVIDGNGDSKVCCVWIVKSNCREAVESMCNAFKKYNRRCSCMEMLISTSNKHRDILETFKEIFPHLHIGFNAYQLLRTIKRDVTVRNCSIDKSQRVIVIDLMNKMVWAQSESEYYKIYNQLCDLNLPKVMDYFNENWHPITGNRHYFQFMNKDTSNCESFTHKLRDVITKHSRLQPYFAELMNSVKDSDESVDQIHQNILASQKVPVALNGENVLHESDDQVVEAQIYGTLTAFAYEVASAEFSAHYRVIFMDQMLPNCCNEAKCYEGEKAIETTLNYCNCDFRTIVKLPCRHIYAYRKQVGHQPLFDPELVAKRWLRPYLKLAKPDICAKRLSNNVNQELTKEEKFSRINQQLVKLGNLISEQSSDRFNHYLGQFQKLSELITEGKVMEFREVTNVSSNEISGSQNGVSSVVLHQPQTCRNRLNSLLTRVKFPPKLTDADCELSAHNGSFRSVESRCESEPDIKKLKMDVLLTEL